MQHLGVNFGGILRFELGFFIWADFKKSSVNTAATGSRPLSRAAVHFPAGANQIRLARRRADLRRPKFGWRRRQTFPAAAEFGASS